MKNYTKVLATVALFAVCFSLAFAQGLQKINITIIQDMPYEDSVQMQRLFESELDALLGLKYDIKLSEANYINTNWSKAEADFHYDRLSSDDNVDIIIVDGVLATSYISKRTFFAKPTILVGILDMEQTMQNLLQQNKTGIDNLNVIVINQEVARGLDAFYDVFPYKNVGLVVSEQIFDLAKVESQKSMIQQIMKKNGTSLSVIPIKNSVDEFFNLQSQVDAVYLGPLGKLDKQRQKLIKKINEKKLPTFSWSVSDVGDGALASLMAQENYGKIFRRIALNIEAILDGENASQLPVDFSLEDRLTINMNTAREIGFSPKFSTLQQAKLLYEFPKDTKRVISFIDVMKEVKVSNLDIQMAYQDKKIAEKDVELATSNLLPWVSLNASRLQIDKKSAEMSVGQQAEKTLSGSVAMSQVVFSEQAFANRTIQKKLLEMVGFYSEQRILDAVLEAATAYFDVLRAKTYRKINEDNVKLTKQNLKIATKRQSVGYSGKSDVYRWEANLANSTTELLAAQQNVKIAKVRLNQILNRPLSEDFSTIETSIENKRILGYLNSIKDYVVNPKSFEVYTNFLVEKAIANSPEIKALDANIAASKRALASSQRKNFVPKIALNAQKEHTFLRQGEGKDAIAGAEPKDDIWSVALNMSLPIFNGGSYISQVRRDRIELNKLKRKRLQLVGWIELNIRAAISDASVKMVNIESSKKAAEFASKSLDLVVDAYAKGGVSIAHLIDAQNTLLNADAVALNSIHQALNTVLKVERAAGFFLTLSSIKERQEFENSRRAYFEKHM